MRALASHQCGPGSNPGVEAIVVGSLPCSERFRVLRFSPLLKNQHFQIRSGTHGHVSKSSRELPSAPWVNKLQFFFKSSQIIWGRQLESANVILVLNTGAQLVKFTFSDSSFFPVFLKILKRLFSVNYVSPTSWQTVAEISMELTQFIKIFKKGCLWRMGLALNKLYKNIFFENNRFWSL